MAERTITQSDLAKALIRSKLKTLNASEVMEVAFPPPVVRIVTICSNEICDCTKDEMCSFAYRSREILPDE